MPQTYDNQHNTRHSPLVESSSNKDYHSLDYNWVYGTWNGQRAIRFTSAALYPHKSDSAPPNFDLYTKGVEFKVGLEDNEGIRLDKRGFGWKPYSMYLIANLFDGKENSESTLRDEGTELVFDSTARPVVTDKNRSLRRILRRPDPYVITSASSPNALKSALTGEFSILIIL